MTCVSLYTITHRDTGREYVGITSSVPTQRWHAHKCDARKGRGTKLARAVAKYGPEAFDWRVVAMFPSRPAAESAERAVIAAVRPAFNITAGGDGVRGLQHTEASRAKMRGPRPALAASAKVRARTPAVRAQLAANGRKTAALKAAAGLPVILMTAEVRAKMSAAAKARCTPEWRTLQASRASARMTPAQIAKMAAGRTKYPPGFACVECACTTKPIIGHGKCKTCFHRRYKAQQRARKLGVV